MVDEVSGAVFEQEITTALPAANQFLAPRLFINNGATAAAVAVDCAGVYLETDFSTMPAGGLPLLIPEDYIDDPFTPRRQHHSPTCSNLFEVLRWTAASTAHSRSCCPSPFVHP